MFYVDKIGRDGYCHLATDQALPDLIEFAGHLGLKPYRLQTRTTHPHYDLRPTKRALAIALGAEPVTSKTLFTKCYRSAK